METDIKNVDHLSTSIVKLQSVLGKKGFNTIQLHSDKEVKDFINSKIPEEHIIGLGDSITTCKLNVRNILLAKGSKIFYSWDGSEDYNRSQDTFETPIRPDYYLTRINAITTSGDILWKDFSKKAVTKKAFPSVIYAFAGFNRIVEKLNKTISIHKYPILTAKPEGCDFTVVLLPYLNY